MYESMAGNEVTVTPALGSNVDVRSACGPQTVALELSSGNRQPVSSLP